MKRHRIPLFDLKVSSQARKEVNKVLASGWLTTGVKAAALEKAFAGKLKVKYAAAVSSATVGLQAVLEALNVAGREVITTPFTFVATIEAIMRSGAQPVFADVDPTTLCLDPDEVARKMTSKTACVIPVDLAGHPADYNTLVPLCSRAKVALVSDASHAFGATYRGNSIAQLSDAAIYSCHATKNVTCGEGGMVVTKHRVLCDQVRLLSLHAMTNNAFQRRQSGKWEYDVVDLGLKGNLSDINAAVGLGQLAVFKQNQTKRQRIAARYAKNLGDLDGYFELPAVQDGCVHAWHLFIIRLHLSRLKISRAQFIKLLADAGVECGVHYKPLFELSYYDAFGWTAQHLPNCAYAGRRVVSLPLYPELKPGDVDYICTAIRRILDRHGRS
jgi:perosamine synthetase